MAANKTNNKDVTITGAELAQLLCEMEEMRAVLLRIKARLAPPALDPVPPPVPNILPLKHPLDDMLKVLRQCTCRSCERHAVEMKSSYDAVPDDLKPHLLAEVQRMVESRPQ